MSLQVGFILGFIGGDSLYLRGIYGLHRELHFGSDFRVRSRIP